MRANLLRRLRDFFHQHGVWEVETPLLSADTVIDRHIDPIRVTLAADSNSAAAAPTYWLQTSPEFGMKRLLAAYAQPIYQITRAFRADEVGAWHNPEFTIVEWYRPAHAMHDAITFLSQLADTLLNSGPAKTTSYRSAFQRCLGLDPMACSEADLRRKAQTLKLLDAASLANAQTWDRDTWLDLLLSQCVQPTLGENGAEIIYDYPASQAALARIRPGDPPLAERFELFVQGVELANGYCELQDADELRRRNQEANTLRQRDGKPPLPEESRLLQAMDHGLPACSGVALGFDRLTMLAAGAESIDQVIAFPIDRA